jgi:HEAT repeat protein
MGTSAAAKRLPRGVRNSTDTNCELRIANLRRCFLLASFLLLLCCAFATVSYAQDEFETFRQIVSRGNSEQKRDALLQIRNLENAEASRIAVPLLRDSSEIVRATAAFSVIFLPKTEAARNLIPLLKDKSPLVRRETAYALGKVQNSEATAQLLQTFQTDKIHEVKNACVVALGEIGDASAIDVLVGILREKLQSKEEFTRRSAARSIGQIAQILQTGRAQVLTPEDFLPVESKTNEIRKSSPEFTVNFPVFRSAISVLTKTLQNSKEFSDVKREAAFALGAIGDKASIPILQANVNNEDYYLAEISRQALLKIAF